VGKARRKAAKKVAPGEPIDFGFFKSEIEKDDGVMVMRGVDVPDPEPNKSGSLNLDFDLIVPFPEGRIIEVFGEESTCKTTLALEVAGNAIQAGKTVLYVNMEKNLNLSLLKSIRSLRAIVDDALLQMDEGGNECPLWIVNPANGEQALEAMKRFAQMVPGGIAILDSVDAAQPEAVMTGQIGENKVGNLGKLMSDAMRKLTTDAERNKVTLIFINQIRDKITLYGDPATTPGGRALKFYSSQRIRLLKPTKADVVVSREGDKVGVIIRYRVIKNKVAPDGNEGAFPVLFGAGIFREQEIITSCANFGILRMGGKGGKQVFLPVIDRATGEYVMEGEEKKCVCMRQIDAARRLLLDEKLCSLLESELRETMEVGSSGIDLFLSDEIQDSEGE
jgi:recombination protein RecA